MQNGCVWLARGVWYLRYRENVVEEGRLIRKLRCVRLAEKSDRYHCKSDLTDVVAEKLSSVRAAEKCPQSADLFATYVEETYFPHVLQLVEKGKMARSTYNAYKTYWKRYIRPYVAGMVMRDFTIATVSTILADAANSYTLNTNTVGKIRSIISAVFSYAMPKGHFPGKVASDNPASHAAIPETATEPQPTHAATFEEAKATLAHLEKMEMHFERTAVALNAMCGLRPSETAGLQWPDWDRANDQLHIQRAVVDGEIRPTKNKYNRFVPVSPELRTILLAHYARSGNPIGGWILSRKGGLPCDMDNIQKRRIGPALNVCTCGEMEDAKHEGHDYRRDDSIPSWNGFYSFRRFHGTGVRVTSGSSDTTSKALGNTKEVADKHYIKPSGVLPDVRKAVLAATAGLTA